MVQGSSSPARWTWFSPWFIIGLVCILAGILTVLAVKNVSREKEFMTRALLSQANVLMRSLEAGSRTGMMGMGWGNRQVQLLMEETAQQPDVIAVALLGPSGKVIAHSDPSQVGRFLNVSMPAAGETSYWFTEGSRNTFEFVRAYQPWFRHRGGGASDMCLAAGRNANKDRNFFMLVSLDPAPFEDASRRDIQQMAVSFVVVFLAGGAGFLTLVWAQNYRSARSSLRDAQAFTATILDQMPVGLMTCDLEGNIRKANDTARQILKRPGGIGGNIHAFPCFEPIAHKLKNGDAVLEQEIHYRMPRGESIPLLVNAAVIKDGDRRRSGYVFLFADTTNIKQLEDQLRRSERLAGLGKLAAGVAHEIRNPLSSIKGFATILSRRCREDERSLKIAEVMVQEVERLNRVVTELLDFARPIEINRSSCTCRDLVENTIRLVERDASHQGVAIETRIDPQDLKVEVDPDRFAQILLNLCLNALQAMEKGGKLRVEAVRKSGRIVFSIVDSGLGIPSDDLPHIFDPYFTTKPRGVGLGLANVHKFVEAHGGEVEVESVQGKGTIFKVLLPSEDGQQHISRLPGPVSEGDMREMPGA